MMRMLEGSLVRYTCRVATLFDKYPAQGLRYLKGLLLSTEAERQKGQFPPCWGVLDQRGLGQKGLKLAMYG